MTAPALPACLSHLTQRDHAVHARLIKTLRRMEDTSADVALQLRNVTLERHRLAERVADLEAELAAVREAEAMSSNTLERTDEH